MRKIVFGIAAILGIVVGTFTISILGWISIISPPYADHLYQKLNNWAEKDE